MVRKWRLDPSLGFVGWITQLIFGVSWWMFPVISKEKQRGSDLLVWGVYGSLNAGLLLRAVAEPMEFLHPGLLWTRLLLLSALLQVLAG